MCDGNRLYAASRPPKAQSAVHNHTRRRREIHSVTSVASAQIGREKEKDMADDDMKHRRKHSMEYICEHSRLGEEDQWYGAYGGKEQRYITNPITRPASFLLFSTLFFYTA